MSINRVILTGNLTRDAELRTTQSGLSIASFGIAVNDRTKNSSTGEWEDYANFFNCTMFGKRAEGVAQYLTKGTRVGIDGRLHYSAWETDGQKRSKVDINVDNLEFLSSRQGGGGEQTQSPDANAYSAPATPVVDENDSVYSENVPF